MILGEERSDGVSVLCPLSFSFPPSLCPFIEKDGRGPRDDKRLAKRRWKRDELRAAWPSVLPSFRPLGCGVASFFRQSLRAHTAAALCITIWFLFFLCLSLSFSLSLGHLCWRNGARDLSTQGFSRGASEANQYRLSHSVTR